MAALPALIVIGTIALTTGLVLGYSAFVETNIVSNSLLSGQSYYFAETGAYDALIKITRDKHFVANTYSLPIGNGIVIIKVEDSAPNEKTITAEANYKNIIRTVKVKISITDYGKVTKISWQEI